MTLVGEPGHGGRLADRPARRDQRAGLAQPQLALVVAGRHPVDVGERAVHGEPAAAGDRGQVAGVDVVQAAAGDQVTGAPGGLPLVYAADAPTLARVRGLAVGRDLATAVYIEEMFKTGHDEANRAAVSAVAADDLPLVGLAVYGPRNAVDKVMKGLPLHP